MCRYEKHTLNNVVPTHVANGSTRAQFCLNSHINNDKTATGRQLFHYSMWWSRKTWFRVYFPINYIFEAKILYTSDLYNALVSVPNPFNKTSRTLRTKDTQWSI